MGSGEGSWLSAWVAKTWGGVHGRDLHERTAEPVGQRLDALKMEALARVNGGGLRSRKDKTRQPTTNNNNKRGFSREATFSGPEKSGARWESSLSHYRLQWHTRTKTRAQK